MPTDGDTPRLSLTAQMISWFSMPSVDMPVLGRAVPGLPVLGRTVRGRDPVAVVYPLVVWKGFEVLIDVLRQYPVLDVLEAG